MYNKLFEKCVVWVVLCAVWFGCLWVLLVVVERGVAGACGGCAGWCCLLCVVGDGWEVVRGWCAVISVAEASERMRASEGGGGVFGQQVREFGTLISSKNKYFE